MGDFERDAAAAFGAGAWLSGDGIAVAASERAARALTNAFHRARRAEGLTAWPAPAIYDWNRFVRETGRQIGRDGRLVLSRIQEQALWTAILGENRRGASRPQILLDAPRRRMAELAMNAHALLCAYAPRYLDAKTRGAWQQDAAAFSGWLSEFDDACRALHVWSAARIPLELTRALETSPAERPPLLLAGFDRLQPVQRRFFDAWGRWTNAGSGAPASLVYFYRAPDPHTELEACAIWCKRKMAENPDARLLVVAQDLARRGGEVERAFLRHVSSNKGPLPFELSLGLPLSSIALARGAHLILHWLTEPLEEREIDWLFSTGQTTAGEAEKHALTGCMRSLRSRGRQRMSWRLESFLAQKTGGAELPSAWASRMLRCKQKLKDDLPKTQSPLAWAELVPELLRDAGWPAARPLASMEFQALRRWQQVLDECASLGFDGRGISWQEFLRALARALDDTLFAPESQDAPIQIAGPAESAGLTADAIWMLGADEDAWPASGFMHPLLPVAVQREAAMPHGSAQLDWDLARVMTARLLASAPEVRFSYARQCDGIETRASGIVAGLAGPPQPLPDEFKPRETPPQITLAFRDDLPVALGLDRAAGGAALLTHQSLCPFKAFAIARLDAQSWQPAQAGLTPAERGQLVHSVLHSIWSGPPGGIRSHAELMAVADLKSFVETHVRRAFTKDLPAAAREQMPQGYIDLEEVRLVDLVTQWLEFERERAPFTVASTEIKKEATIAGLQLDLRLDRIDRLADGSFLVMDYKTGDVSPRLWDLPRPEDAQLPLYAGFALDPIAEPLGGLVFAKLRPGGHEFAGRVRNAREILLPNAGARTELARRSLTDDEVEAWQRCIETLARDFLAGRAEADPRDYPKTCQRCGLHVLCRIHENRASAEDADDEEAGDE